MVIADAKKDEISEVTEEDEQKAKAKAEREARKLAKKAEKAAQLQRRKLRLEQKGPSPNAFPGLHKWLGGAVDKETGKIYGIPSHAIDVICISTYASTNTNTNTSEGDEQKMQKEATISTIPLPNEYKIGKFKWLRGIIHDGYLYGIPAWSTHGVLKVRLREKHKHKDKHKRTRGPRVKLLPLPHPHEYYRGGGDDNDDQNENQDQNQIEENGSPKKFGKGRHQGKYSDMDRGRWMWHGGAIGQSHNGEAIYCIPSNAEHVLKVNLSTEIVEEIGQPLTRGQNKWYGGIIGKDGCIYGMPYTASGVLRINPKTDSVQVLGHFPWEGYKWHGGLLAHSTGVIYAFPAHSNEVLCVNTNPNIELDEDRISTIPIERHDEDTDSSSLTYKWLGGSYGADGCIYGMPSDATSILRIDPITNKATTFGRCSATKNKWQVRIDEIMRHTHCLIYSHLIY